MIPCAYLRIFQPLEAFPAEEQAKWERYIVEGGWSRPARPLYRQHVTGRRLGFLVPAEREDAEVRMIDGAYFVCPSRTRLRVLAGLLSFREVEPIEGAEFFVSDADARRAQRELVRMRRRDPGAVSFLMQSPWHVPIRWFALVDDDERRLVERGGGGHRLLYRATTRNAIRRAERAVTVLRRSELGSVADAIVELIEWMSAFDHRSLLELDYDGLCDLLTWDELDDDHSAREVLEAIEALESGELSRSADVYQQVAGRWAEIRAHESLN